MFSCVITMCDWPMISRCRDNACSKFTNPFPLVPKDTHSFLTDKPELCGDSIMWLGKEHRPWLGGRFVSVTWDMQELEAKSKDIAERDILKFRLTL